MNKPPQCSGCALESTGKGFCLGAGDPKTAKMAVVLEAPGQQELTLTLRPNPNRAFLSTQEECDKELAIRRRDYPEMEERFLKLGLPIAGPTGSALQFWVWKKLGLKREDFYIDNTIRCLSPKGKDGAYYPKGEDRKSAELHCRVYDRLASFAPDTAVISIHPAALLRGEVTMLPLLVKDFEKVRDFTAQGRKVLTLLGGKAAHGFLGYAQNVTRWRGSYQALSSDWPDTYKTDFEYTRKRKREPKVMTEGVCGKKHKGKKAAPKCGYVGCVEDFQRRTDADKVQP